MLTLSQAKLEFNEIGEQFFEGLISFDEMMAKIADLTSYPLDKPLKERFQESPYTEFILVPVYRDKDTNSVLTQMSYK